MEQKNFLNIAGLTVRLAGAGLMTISTFLQAIVPTQYTLLKAALMAIGIVLLAGGE